MEIKRSGRILEPEAGAQDRGRSGLGGEALELPAREPGCV